MKDLKNYDDVVTTYYDLRDANRRIDSFTKQITGKKLDLHETDRDQLPEELHKQGLCLDWAEHGEQADYTVKLEEIN